MPQKKSIQNINTNEYYPKKVSVAESVPFSIFQCGCPQYAVTATVAVDNFMLQAEYKNLIYAQNKEIFHTFVRQFELMVSIKACNAN